MGLPDRIRDEIYEYLDLTFHRSVMAIEPHRSSEEHRERLARLQSSRREELEALGSCKSPEELTSLFLGKAGSGAFDEIPGDARFLGVPTILESLDAFRAKITELGIDTNQHPPSTIAAVAALATPSWKAKPGSPPPRR